MSLKERQFRKEILGLVRNIGFVKKSSKKM